MLNMFEANNKDTRTADFSIGDLEQVNSGCIIQNYS